MYGKESTVVENTSVLRDIQIYQPRPSFKGKGTPLYSIYIIDLETGRPAQKFGFDVAPQQMRLNEEAAAEAAALQDGGFFSDERGQYFKILNVSGSFGYRPTAKQQNSGFIQSSLAQVQQSLNQLQTGISKTSSNIPIEEITGYDRYRTLHNLFRFYWDMKKKRSSAAKYCMVWADWKMGEVYYCQALGFDRERAVPSGRMKVNYSFRLRLLAPLQIIKPVDFLISPGSQQGQQGILNLFKNAARFLQSVNELLLDSVTASVDIGFDVITTIYRPLDEALNFIDTTIKGLSLVTQKTLNIAQLPLNSLRNIHRACLSAAPILYGLDGFREIGHTYMMASRNIQQAYIAMVSAIFQTDVNATARSIGNKYRQWDSDAALTPNDPINGNVLYGDRGSHTAIGSYNIPKGSKTIVLPQRTSIKSLALNYLGSAGRWKEIVVLNRLRPPYISPSGNGTTVLRPGDPIKLPDTLSETDDNAVYAIEEDYYGSDTFKYGRDLRLDLETKDLMANGKGDLDTIGGIDNLEQAVHIKIWRSPGDLKAHPWFGFGAKGGQGISADALSGYSLQLKTMLLSDSRIEHIKAMAMEVNGDILLISCKCVPKDNDNTILLNTRKSLR